MRNPEMQQLSWSEDEMAGCAIDVGRPLSDDNTNRPLSCMSAFNEDGPHTDVLMYSTQSMYNEDAQMQAERDSLLQEREKLVINQTKSQDQLRTLNLHVESLAALVQEASVENRRLQHEIRAANAEISCQERDLLRREPASNPWLSSPLSSLAAGHRLDAPSHEFVLKTHISNSQSSSLLMQGFGSSRGSKVDVAETLSPSKHASSHAPSRRYSEGSQGPFVPSLDCSSFKAAGPSSPSVGSLSTRSGTQAPSVCSSNLLTHRSSVASVGFLSPTPLAPTPEVGGITRASSAPRVCQQSPLERETDRTRLLSVSRDTPQLPSDDMASTRAKLAELEDQIRRAKATAELRSTASAAAKTTNSQTRRQLWDWPEETQGQFQQRPVAHTEVRSRPSPPVSQRTADTERSRAASQPRSSYTMHSAVAEQPRRFSRVCSPPRSGYTMHSAVAAAAGSSPSDWKRDARQASASPRAHSSARNSLPSRTQSSTTGALSRSKSAPRTFSAYARGGTSRDGSPRNTPATPHPHESIRRSRSSPAVGSSRPSSVGPYSSNGPCTPETAHHSYRSPRSPSGPRRLERTAEDWARRGITGASPAPRKPTACGEGSVRVICRVRPAKEEPRAFGYIRPPHAPRCVEVANGECVEIREPEGAITRSFVVDSAFGEDAKTDDIYLNLRRSVQTAMRGGDAAILAYGPTGAGKSHTMYGDAMDIGLVPRAVAELLSADQGLIISMVELHNDTMTDLLLPKGELQRQPVEIKHWQGNAMAYIEGARELSGNSVTSVLTAIQSGLARRHMASTMVNSTSSRSHVFISFSVGVGRLTFVDLAGLERVKRSGVEGNVLREAQSINRSLHSLGDVVDALRRGSSHVPVRNSRLAQLVAGTLRNGTETALIVCVPPEESTRDEAMSALCFAERVRRIPGAAGLATARIPEGTSAGACARGWSASVRSRSR